LPDAATEALAPVVRIRFYTSMSQVLDQAHVFEGTKSMSAQYRKIYQRRFRRLRQGGWNFDHLFLWKAASAPDAFNGLADLLTAWSARSERSCFVSD